MKCTVFFSAQRKMANQDGNKIAALRIGQKRRNTIVEQLRAEADNYVNKRDNHGKLIRGRSSRSYNQ